MTARGEGVTFTFPSGPLGTIIALDLIFGVILFWPLLVMLVVRLVVTSRNPAPRLAQQLAQRADLALPTSLEDRLNRFLRARRAVHLLTLLALSQVVLFALSLNAGDSRADHVTELGLLPAVAGLPCMLASLWPRWRTNGHVHLAHLRRLAVRDTLTDREWAAVAAAYCTGGVLIAWALSRAGLALWSVPAVVALACQGLLTYGVARNVMAQPAAGGDNLELAWDDVLRLKRARSVVASGSFVMLGFLIAAAGDMAGVAVFHSMVFLVPVGALGSAAATAWNRSPAHKNWRRAWPPDQSSVVS